MSFRLSSIQISLVNVTFSSLLKSVVVFLGTTHLNLVAAHLYCLLSFQLTRRNVPRHARTNPASVEAMIVPIHPVEDEEHPGLVENDRVHRLGNGSTSRFGRAFITLEPSNSRAKTREPTRHARSSRWVVG